MGGWIHSLVQILVEGLVLPVGGDDVFHSLGVFGADYEGGGLVPGKFLQGSCLIVAVEFWIKDAVPRTLLAAASGKELIVVDVDGHVLANVLQSLCPAKDKELAFGLAHGFSEEQGSFHVDVGLFAFKGCHKAVEAGMLFGVGIGLAGNAVENELFLFGKGAVAHHGGVSPFVSFCLKYFNYPLLSQN